MFYERDDARAPAGSRESATLRRTRAANDDSAGRGCCCCCVDVRRRVLLLDDGGRCSIDDEPLVAKSPRVPLARMDRGAQGKKKRRESLVPRRRATVASAESKRRDGFAERMRAALESSY